VITGVTNEIVADPWTYGPAVATGGGAGRLNHLDENKLVIMKM
jgi:hypothetical protein